MLHSIKNSNDIDMSISSKAKAIWQFYLCDQLQFTDLQNMKINSFLCVFSAKNTTRHDLDNIFTKNVNNVTQYVNVVINVSLVTLQKL